MEVKEEKTTELSSCAEDLLLQLFCVREEDGMMVDMGDDVRVVLKELVRYVREKELEEPVIGADGNPVIGADGRMETQKVVRRVMEPFDFGVFRQLWLRVRADVGAASQFSEIATTQTLDNLRAAGVLDIVQYLERVPERLIPRKQELIEALKKQESGTAKTGGQGAEQMLGAMSGNTQTRYHALPRAARSALQRQTAMRSR